MHYSLETILFLTNQNRISNLLVKYFVVFFGSGLRLGCPNHEPMTNVWRILLITRHFYHLPQYLQFARIPMLRLISELVTQLGALFNEDIWTSDKGDASWTSFTTYGASYHPFSLHCIQYVEVINDTARLKQVYIFNSPLSSYSCNTNSLQWSFIII